jgi:FkbM family methyltransferase
MKNTASNLPWDRSLWRLLPVAVRNPVWRARNALTHITQNWQLARLRRRMFSNPSRTTGMERCFGYTVHINDGPNFYILVKDIFNRRIYDFSSRRPDPFILDCGSNIGMSILYFKHVYPAARIIGFEPDPAIFPLLEENVTSNRLSDVRLVRAAVAGRAGNMTFNSDGKCESCLAEHRSSDAPGWERVDVACVRLRDYLTEQVDFLKMNIEGAEWESLANSEDRLRQVREMVIEYHHLPGLARTLHEILGLFHRQGFDYLVNDLDSETNPGVRPPFALTPESRYYLLIYAHRMD